MRSVSLAEVVRGRLMNNVHIEVFGRFVFAAKQVKRGDCYIFLDEDINALRYAIKAGAFAVIYYNAIDELDSETAFIRAQSVDRALQGLLRYLFISAKRSVFCADRMSVAIAKSLIVDSSFVATNDLQTAIVALQGDPPPLLMCEKDGAIANACADIHALAPVAVAALKRSITETTALFGDRQYSFALPSLFLPQLAAVIHFALDRKLRFNPKNPIDSDRLNIHILPDNRAIIVDQASEKEQKEAIDYLFDIAAWAKIIIVSAQPIDEAIKRLYYDRYDYAYINGVDRAELFARLELLKPRAAALF
ncbi:MAG: hypothetical protein LBN32_00235 [Helicobacteraceae bacterium]|jgi:hypothetical protein|nr:hypothetical protein [Helicobacteraceae bacterium]